MEKTDKQMLKELVALQLQVMRMGKGYKGGLIPNERAIVGEISTAIIELQYKTGVKTA